MFPQVSAHHAYAADEPNMEGSPSVCGRQEIIIQEDEFCWFATCKLMRPNDGLIDYPYLCRFLTSLSVQADLVLCSCEPDKSVLVELRYMVSS